MLGRPPSSGTAYKLDSNLSSLTIHLRSKDPEQVGAWHELLHADDSPALVGLDAHEKELIRNAFDIAQERTKHRGLEARSCDRFFWAYYF